jgi:hypothetical protein
MYIIVFCSIFNQPRLAGRIRIDYNGSIRVKPQNRFISIGIYELPSWKSTTLSMPGSCAATGATPLELSTAREMGH